VPSVGRHHPVVSTSAVASSRAEALVAGYAAGMLVAIPLTVLAVVIAVVVRRPVADRVVVQRGAR
jgi:biopolymer transport protein ExbB/TolQ